MLVTGPHHWRFFCHTDSNKQVSHSQLCASVLILHENKRDYLIIITGGKIGVGTEPIVGTESLYVCVIVSVCVLVHQDVLNEAVTDTSLKSDGQWP